MKLDTLYTVGRIYLGPVATAWWSLPETRRTSLAAVFALVSSLLGLEVQNLLMAVSLLAPSPARLAQRLPEPPDRRMFI